MTTSTSSSDTITPALDYLATHLRATNDLLQQSDADAASDTLTTIISALRDVIAIVRQQQAQLNALNALSASSASSQSAAQDSQDSAASLKALFEYRPAPIPAPVIASEQPQTSDPLPFEDGWRAAHSALLTAGYVAGVPNEQCWQDAACFAEDRCPTCGGAVEFLPFVRRVRMNMMTGHFERAGYRAFVVCGGCDQHMEF